MGIEREGERENTANERKQIRLESRRFQKDSNGCADARATASCSLLFGHAAVTALSSRLPGLI